MTLHLRYAARSDIGLLREGNEDSGYAGPSLLMVADGMGGHAAGELASAIAVATVSGLEVHPPSENDILASLGDAVDEVGEGIADVIADDPELTGMGTTITGVYWLRDRVAVVHVGDSRAYLLRDGALTQVTHDHTYVQTLVDAGRITEAEAAFHPRRNLLMRALDGMNPVAADLTLLEVLPGDRFLLCTDGLSGVLTPEEIRGLLSGHDPTGSVTHLVDLALERGAPDNVTVVVADVVDTPDEEGGAPVVVGAAGETRVRLRLPGVRFPDDAQPDPDRPDLPPPMDSGPPTAPQAPIDADIRVPAARRQPPVRRRRRWLWLAVVVVVLVIALAAGSVVVARSWLHTQWYVSLNGSPGTGTVAVYQGVQGTLLGFSLSELRTDSGLLVGTLPYFDQELVSKGIPASDETDAARIVAELGDRAAQCQTLLPPSGCPGTP
jgi:protein phosphatase